jgi:hypothetical protein
VVVVEFTFNMCRTECRGWVVGTPASYFGGPVFKSRPGDILLTEVLSGFPQPSRRTPGYYPKTMSWPLPSKYFPIYHSIITCHSILCSLSCWKGVAKLKKYVNMCTICTHRHLLFDGFCFCCGYFVLEYWSIISADMFLDSSSLLWWVVG